MKTELLEMTLSKGCKILNMSDSTIVGTLSSNIKSQLRSLDLSTKTVKLKHGTVKKWYSKENMDVFEKLLLSCSSLQHLNIEGLLLTPKMADGICKNGKTLQALNINDAYNNYYNTLDNTVLNGDLETIMKCCHQLKNLDFISGNDVWLNDDSIKFLVENMSPNVVRLNLNNIAINYGNLKKLLSRCNKIKVLILEAPINGVGNSLKTIRQYLNHTLEELSLGYYRQIGSAGVFELKSMPRLKILNLHISKEDDEKVQNLRQHLPHLIIRTSFD